MKRRLIFLVLVVAMMVTVSLTPGHDPRAAQAAGWVPMPGFARFAAAGGAPSLYATSDPGGTGGYAIYQWTGASWVFIPGYAYQLAIGSDGTIWAHQGNAIYRRIGPTGSTWTPTPGAANWLASGATGTWATGISCNGSGDCAIYQWTGATWSPIPGFAYRIAIAADGTLWAIQNSGSIYRWNGSFWTPIAGRAKDIAAGGDGSVWAIGYIDGCDVNGNCPIYKWNGSTWINQGGLAQHITIDSAGVAYAQQNTGSIYHMP